MHSSPHTDTMEALHPDQHHGYQEDEEGDEGGSGITLRDQFLDLDDLGFLTIEGIDTNLRTILRVVGKFLPGKTLLLLFCILERERERTRTE